MKEIVELPESILKQVRLIRMDFDRMFMEDWPIEYEALSEIENLKVKLAALTDLEQEAKLQISIYIQKYSDYLWGITDLINKKKTEYVLIYSEVYDIFFEREIIYRSFLMKLDKLIKKTKVRIQVDGKYREHNRTKSKIKQLTVLEIEEQFHKLFISPAIEAKIIALLKKHDYISNENKWLGVSDNHGELREAYLVLKKCGLLAPGYDPLPSLRIVYKRFGLNPEEPGIEKPYISSRSLGDKKTTKDYDLFMEIFEHLSSEAK